MLKLKAVKAATCRRMRVQHSLTILELFWIKSVVVMRILGRGGTESEYECNSGDKDEASIHGNDSGKGYNNGKVYCRCDPSS